MAQNQETLARGTLLLDGKYEVEALIGQGASGQVYRVRHRGLRGLRALKVVGQHMAGVGEERLKEYRERLMQEFRLAELAKSPRLIQVYDVQEDPAGQTLYAEMELAEGGSVADLLRREGRVSVDRALDLLRDAAEGLAAIPRAGIVHRAVSPANLLLMADGRLKVSDLGLAQWDGAPDRFGDTRWGSAGQPHPGTPGYRSPEHDRPGPLHPTADVYGLGCVAFQLLTGQPWDKVQHRVQGTRPVVLR